MATTFADRAPDSLAGGTPQPLRAELEALLGEAQVLSRPIDLVRYASDAGPYRRFPRVVVMARDEHDVARTLRHAATAGLPVTFRAAGTSLNGQAQTDGILIDVRRHFSGVRIAPGGERVTLRAGTLLGFANRLLAGHGRRLGPDPGSTNIATIGGVIANNSGGMRCGTTWDAYSTVESMTLVLADGTLLDTAAPGAEAAFAAAAPELAAGLLELRDEVRADAELSARIRRKFSIKNTMGYRLCAFLDADTPLEIFRRLVVGSEGTLAFVAEAVLRTRPEPARTTVAWLHFPTIDAAVAPVPALIAAGARAAELMVAPALVAAAWNIPGSPQAWKELPLESAALLVELGGDDDAQLDAAQAAAVRVLDGHRLLQPPGFTRDERAIEQAWTVREGLYGLMGRVRPAGTALIVEDVCVPPADMARCARDLQALLTRHGFAPGVAGHVSAGNLHFSLTPDFGRPEDLARYEAFMEDMVDLIVDVYDGSLKAEHGTGVNMAPHLEREWGPKATDIMWRLKALADPGGVLNPGTMLNRDPHCHLRDLKSQPPIEAYADACVECGFCEPVCPSRNATTTPRQRIVLRRELARQPHGSPVARAILEDFGHDVLDTCAADGTCAPVCPVAIDTGRLVKDLRAQGHRPAARRAAATAARHFGTVERAARAGVRAGHAAGGLLGDRALPEPAPGALPRSRREGAAAVYLPACVNRIFGAAEAGGGRTSLPTALVTVSARAGVPLWIPADAAGHCCATPWASKGYTDGHAVMAARVAEALWRWTDGGRLPVVIDASSCALGLVAEVPAALEPEARARHEQLEILDSVAWAHDRLLPGLQVARRVGTVAVHPTCATGHLGLTGTLQALAGALAEEVVIPAGTTCCGMAGDRGLLHPEVPASALREVAAGLVGRTLDACLCSNRTCEIGLQQVTGRPYESFVYLLEELTRP
ncbi:FAD-binding oxidoreductase [Baekduia soli]|uniref:D-lactate dehydrogenase (cytochrome) n=1 Tax=Baekduia soli TaxID=496014 RepID=A0A5B8U9S9_9ACTN|nr:FAD-binding and (Fe-S)-binding domain-containing protein [Baekduia soli]QEC49361.1 FAD-binding oxidoreductase [Baekduia soli]